MAKTAEVADKLTVVRSMTHTEVDHSRGEHSMFTGYRPSPALTYPSLGSVTAHELGPRNDMPPYIVVPDRRQPVPRQRLPEQRSTARSRSAPTPAGPASASAT